MKSIYLSKTEKKILKELRLNTFKIENYKREDLFVAAKRLAKEELISAAFIDGGIESAQIKEKGIFYLNENPTLENPADENKLINMQINELQHKKRIRIPKNIVLYGKLFKIIVAVVYF